MESGSPHKYTHMQGWGPLQVLKKNPEEQTSRTSIKPEPVKHKMSKYYESIILKGGNTVH